eukprot:CAMPEP_0172646482 /NCGR_PEP_ID=MMETSP1068-20121228/240263_1 /TAXON_ID=35684 /ORGANISM="Pseudopedinella elastica, Strain CCMP716" /LENGTH=259 /DNA_ID=CAMNT_0013460745 /DNA_START=72 /DNA_END=851 /DNA_ORIENTATION=-
MGNVRRNSKPSGIQRGGGGSRFLKVAARLGSLRSSPSPIWHLPQAGCSRPRRASGVNYFDLLAEVAANGQFTRVGDDDLGLGGAAAGAHGLDGADHVQALKHLPEHHVLAVQPRRLHRADEKLGAVRVLSSVRHRQNARARVLELEIFVLELVAVNGLATAAVAVGKIAALKHKLRNNAVECGALVGQSLAALAYALLPGAKSPEVFNGFGNHVAEKTHHDSARGLSTDGNIEENFVGDGCLRFRITSKEKANDGSEKE